MEEKKKKKCLACDVDLQYMRRADFRTGGYEGLSKLFLGVCAELDETTIPFDMYICPTCRKIEFYAK